MVRARLGGKENVGVGTTYLLPNNFTFCARYSSCVIAPDSLAFCKSTNSWPNVVPLARCASRLPMAATQPLRSSMVAIAHIMLKTASLVFMLFCCCVDLFVGDSLI